MLTKTAVRAALLQHRDEIVRLILVDLERYCSWYGAELNGLWIQYRLGDLPVDRVALLGRAPIKVGAELSWPKVAGNFEAAEARVRAWADVLDLFVAREGTFSRRSEMEVSFHERIDTLRPGKSLTPVGWRIVVPTAVNPELCGDDVIVASVVEFSMHEALESVAVSDCGVTKGGVAKHHRAGTVVDDRWPGETRALRSGERFICESHPLWPHQDFGDSASFEVLMRFSNGMVMCQNGISF
jgi:hypothetical protein